MGRRREPTKLGSEEEPGWRAGERFSGKGADSSPLGSPEEALGEQRHFLGAGDVCILWEEDLNKLKGPFQLQTLQPGET